jgi:hypothetical protein
VPLLALAVHQLTLSQLGEERGMAWENAEITQLTGDIQLVYLFLRQDTRRG